MNFMHSSTLRIIITGLIAVSLSACITQPQLNKIQPYTELQSKALKSTLAYEVVKSLTVEVGPRIPGSEGDKKVVLWAEDKFAELGFDRIYKQPVRVRNWARGFTKIR